MQLDYYQHVTCHVLPENRLDLGENSLLYFYDRRERSHQLNTYVSHLVF